MRTKLSVLGMVVVVGLCVSIPTAVGAVGAAQTGSTRMLSSVAQCQNGGWRTLTNSQGQLFPNQGLCISYEIQHPVSLADLAGSFSGTQSFTNGNGCTMVHQAFDATYQGSSAVGLVTLHLDGCDLIAGSIGFTFDGTFTITTSVDSLAGNATGLATVPDPPPIDYELTLTITSGTGAFAVTTGTLHASIQWPGATPVTGSVPVP